MVSSYLYVWRLRELSEFSLCHPFIVFGAAEKSGRKKLLLGKKYSGARVPLRQVRSNRETMKFRKRAGRSVGLAKFPGLSHEVFHFSLPLPVRVFCLSGR